MFAGVEFREVEVVKFLGVVWVEAVWLEVVVMVNPHLLENEKWENLKGTSFLHVIPYTITINCK